MAGNIISYFYKNEDHSENSNGNDNQLIVSNRSPSIPFIRQMMMVVNVNNLFNRTKNAPLTNETSLHSDHQNREETEPTSLMKSVLGKAFKAIRLEWITKLTLRIGSDEASALESANGLEHIDSHEWIAESILNEIVMELSDATASNETSDGESANALVSITSNEWIAESILTEIVMKVSNATASHEPSDWESANALVSITSLDSIAGCILDENLMNVAHATASHEPSDWESANALVSITSLDSIAGCILDENLMNVAHATASNETSDGESANALVSITSHEWIAESILDEILIKVSDATASDETSDGESANGLEHIDPHDSIVQCVLEEILQKVTQCTTIENPNVETLTCSSSSKSDVLVLHESQDFEDGPTEIVRAECTCCHRFFSLDRLSIHERICKTIQENKKARLRNTHPNIVERFAALSSKKRLQLHRKSALRRNIKSDVRQPVVQPQVKSVSDETSDGESANGLEHIDPHDSIVQCVLEEILQKVTQCTTTENPNVETLTCSSSSKSDVLVLHESQDFEDGPTEIVRAECTCCHRFFSLDRLSIHERICKTIQENKKARLRNTHPNIVERFAALSSKKRLQLHRKSALRNNIKSDVRQPVVQPQVKSVAVVLEETPPDKRIECSFCHRRFCSERIETHKRICKYSNQTKRAPFNSSMKRITSFTYCGPRQTSPCRKNQRKTTLANAEDTRKATDRISKCDDKTEK